MDRSQFWRAVIAGLIATHVLDMTGYWQAGIGIPQMDVGTMLAKNMGQLYAWGKLAHFLNGVVMALIYARWLYNALPGPRLAKGAIYGVMAWVAAGLIVVPLAAPAGVFFTKTPSPGMMNLASLIIHLAYGVALGIAYEPRPAERR